MVNFDSNTSQTKIQTSNSNLISKKDDSIKYARGSRLSWGNLLRSKKKRKQWCSNFIMGNEKSVSFLGVETIYCPFLERIKLLHFPQLEFEWRLYFKYFLAFQSSSHIIIASWLIKIKCKFQPLLTSLKIFLMAMILHGINTSTPSL